MIGIKFIDNKIVNSEVRVIVISIVIYTLKTSDIRFLRLQIYNLIR